MTCREVVLHELRGAVDQGVDHAHLVDLGLQLVRPHIESLRAEGHRIREIPIRDESYRSGARFVLMHDAGDATAPEEVELFLA